MAGGGSAVYHTIFRAGGQVAVLLGGRSQGDSGWGCWVGGLQVSFPISLSNLVSQPISFLIHSFPAQIS